MPAKRLLFAAEFMRGAATLARLLPLAKALADRGHEIVVATADTAVTGFETLTAPRWSAPPPTGFVAISYADVLMHGGYATPDALRGLMDGWRDVLVRTRPDLLIADFAPTAMLTARVASIPVAAVGDGFSLPPPTSPLPDMRPWAGTQPDAIASVEGRVLAVINARLATLRARELPRLAGLFSGVARYLFAFPELDHYPVRPNGTWYGAVFPHSDGPAPVWPGGAGERVYIELDPRHPALPRIVEALDSLGLPTLVQAAGLPDRLANAIQRRAICPAAGADRAEMLAGCDIAVCQSLDVAAPALLAGKPLLMLPVFGEQMMTLHRVARQGLGHGAAPDADTGSLDAALRRLVNDRACRSRAAGFARTYDGYRPDDAVEAAANEIHGRLNQP